MKIVFTGKSNDSVVKINTATFKLSNGDIVTVDRDNTRTLYNFNNDKILMVWSNVYLWDGKCADYDIGADLFEEFVEFEYEDEADEDYYFDVEDFEFVIEE